MDATALHLDAVKEEGRAPPPGLDELFGSGGDTPDLMDMASGETQEAAARE